MKVLVIGAGPAGLSAAVSLAERGFEVELFEASSEVGGLAKTIELWDQVVDIGPHRFFSTDKRVNEFWLRFAKDNYRLVDRNTRILYRKRFIQYPIQFSNLCKELSSFEIALLSLSYLKQKILPDKEYRRSFETWVVHRFGYRLYQQFFKTYSEKLWGIPCDQLSSDFAAQRIQNFSAFEAVKGLIPITSKSQHKTVTDRFAYPLDGTGSIYKEMLAEFKSLGGVVHFNTAVQTLQASEKRITSICVDGIGSLACDHVISTMPLTKLVDSLPQVPNTVQQAKAELKFRSTVLVYLQLKGSDYFKDNWVYVHSPELQVGRITNFRNWAPEMTRGQRETIVCMEYWTNIGAAFWRLSDEEICAIASSELPKTGLAPKSDILESKVLRIPYCYPVYEQGYEKHLQVLTEFISGYDNLWAIGRYGAFKYNNQDHSILMGLIASDLIANGATSSQELWEINSDYDAYHEEAIISEAGLQSIRG